MWAEQLLAESTGKQGVGIVPVDQEPLGGVSAYGSDRVFVRIRVADSEGAKAADGTSADTVLEQLAAAGHPVIEIDLPDPMDLAGEFVRWEIATAIAGIILGIDPFDQPNVEEAKENTAPPARASRRALRDRVRGRVRPRAPSPRRAA